MSETTTTNTPAGARLPKQDRARKTYEKILFAAQEILEESGIEALSSNAIVARAGVTAPAFYRYFKDKHALLAVLASRLWDARNVAYLKLIEDLEIVDDKEYLHHKINLLLHEIYRITTEFTGARALLISLRALPALSSVRLEDHERLAHMMAELLVQVRPALSMTEACERCRLTNEIGYCAVEMLLEVPTMDRDMVLARTARACLDIALD